MSHPLDDWYRHHFENAEGNPPPEVWREIQNGINVKRNKTFFSWERFAVLSLAFLLLPIFTGNSGFAPTNNAASRETASSHKPIKYEAPPQENSAIVHPVSAGNTLAAFNQNKNLTEGASIHPVHHLEPSVNRVEFIDSKNLSFLTKASQEFNVITLERIEQYPSEITPSRKIHFDKFQIGPFCYMQSNILLNNEFRYYSKRTSNNALAVNKGYSYGILFSLKLSEQQSVEASYFSNESAGQSYKIYQGGRYVNEEIGLSYSGIGLQVSRTIIRSNPKAKHPVRLALVPGISIMKIKHQEVFLSNLAENTSTNQYRKLNANASFALRYELDVTHKMTLGVEGRISGGLININKGSEAVPDWFNRTHTANVALGVFLKRSF